MSRCTVFMLTILAGHLVGCGGIPTLVPSEEHRLQVRMNAPGQPARPRPANLRIVSYNIQYGEDLDLALSDLATDPDLVGCEVLLLQEMDPDGAALMARRLGLDLVYYPASINPHHGKPFGNAVLSAWPILASQLIVLPHAQPVTGSRRIATVAHLDVAGVTVRAVSVHTATVVTDQEHRFAQFQALADSLGPWPGPQVVGGDFNTVTQMEAAKLRRVLDSAGLETIVLPPGPTTRDWRPRLLEGEPVLDHLFQSGFNVENAGIVEAAEASDHLPIWAVLRLPNDIPVQEVKSPE